MNQLSLFCAEFDPCVEWLASFNECIAEGISNAGLIPYKLGACPMDAITNVRAVLEAEGWVWNNSAQQLERAGWFVWFRSQGRISSPIAQWGRL